MPELLSPYPDRLSLQISPAAAMAMTLPLVELAPRYPGIDPWLAQLSGRLGRAVRADVRLLCVPLSGVLSYLLEHAYDEESMQPALDALAAASPDEILSRVLLLLAGRTDHRDPEIVRRWISDEPQRVLEIIASLQRPSAEEPFEIDAERTLSLLRQPAALKSLAELRLRQLWYDHFAPRWREVLPVCRALRDEAERHFHLGDPVLVAEAIIGRKGHERIASMRDKRIVFVPIPFLGPYVSTMGTDEYPVAFVGFGVVQGGDVTREASRRDLLAALTALADESRLKALALIHQKGEARAADFMIEFGWSQPATSRHLRALESTGLLHVERIDGMKRYTIHKERARAIARALERFLTNE